MTSVRWIHLAEPQLLMHYLLFPVTVTRLALRPFTFSNGVTVPAGTIIATPTSAVQTDGEIYPNPEQFDGFRFAKLRERDGDTVTRHLATSTSAGHLSFGLGRHAWCFFFFCLNQSQSLMLPYQPWSLLLSQRG